MQEDTITVHTPSVKNCRLKINLYTVMDCHVIAKELHDNTQSTDDVFDKFNQGEETQRHMMKVVELILLETIDPDWRFNNAI
tara:strand:+ start:6800 stop:7045 length:246 start_codon:yes stop_codon:yes gene_type:complete